MSSSTAVSLSMFQTVSHIARGGFGTVTLTRKITGSDRGIFYAIKKICKNKLRGKLFAMTLRERNALVASRHCPFISKIHYAFQDNESVYFGMEYVEGNTLAQEVLDRVFTKYEVMLYSSEIVVALEYLHSMSIVHRDLKPSNVMLDRRGHIKVVDFGMSRKLTQGRSYSFCGSPTYVSPEMMRKSGHGFEVDLWGLGLIMYEMLMGKGPFGDTEEDSTDENNSYTLYKEVSLPKYYPYEIRDLVCKLLEEDPKRRLYISGVKSHQFFSIIDWDAVANGSYIPAKSPKTQADLLLRLMMTPMPRYSDFKKENVVKDNFVENFDYVSPFL